MIGNGGRRAIGIALRPQDFVGGIMAMNRCHGRRHLATRRGHRGARRSLPWLCRPSRQCAVVALNFRQGHRAQGRSRQRSGKRRTRAFSTFYHLPPWATSSCRLIDAKSANFGPFPYLAFLLTIVIALIAWARSYGTHVAWPDTAPLLQPGSLNRQAGA